MGRLRRLNQASYRAVHYLPSIADGAGSLLGWQSVPHLAPCSYIGDPQAPEGCDRATNVTSLREHQTD